MSGDKHRALVTTIVAALAPIEPRWALTGGGALVHVYLHHRSTKDLDLFWHGIQVLGELPTQVEQRLVSCGLVVRPEQRAPGFVRLRVSDANATLLIDLVATSAVVVDPPRAHDVAGTSILVDSPQEILTNKLTALLSRSELRDLIDIRALVDAGCDLDRALRDAPRKDGGFSPATLAWIVESFPLRAIAAREGLDVALTETLDRFRKELVERLTVAAAPE